MLEKLFFSFQNNNFAELCFEVLSLQINDTEIIILK